MSTANASVVVRTASTPHEAKLFVAMLQAEGIPAYAEGEALADSIAVSRRLMNLQGCRVLVPANVVAEATDILAASTVSAAELDEQALACAAEAEPVAGGARSGLGLVALSFGVLIVIYTGVMASVLDGFGPPGSARPESAAPGK